MCIKTARFYVRILYSYCMITLTATNARANLSGFLRRALKGEDIGIMIEGRVVALRPVNVTSTDYVEAEYGLDTQEWETTAKNLHEKGKAARQTGKAKRFTGNIEDALGG
jgi:antitoxin (DNA-binding transcriptional repressor) of toxin-antitoxin stability system